MRLLIATVLVFLIASAFEFSGSWAAGQKGLIAFEKACPIHSLK